MAFNPAFLGLGSPAIPFSIPTQFPLVRPQFLKNSFRAIKTLWKRHRRPFLVYVLRGFIRLSRSIVVVYDNWCTVADFRWLPRWFPFVNDNPMTFSEGGCGPASCHLYPGNTSRYLDSTTLHNVDVTHASTSNLSSIPKSGAKLTATKPISTCDIGCDESYEHDWLPPRFEDPPSDHVTFKDDPDEQEISPPSSPAYYSFLNEEPIKFNPLPPPPRPKHTPITQRQLPAALQLYS